MLEILSGDYVECCLRPEDKWYFNGIALIEDAWYQTDSVCFIIENIRYYKNEIKLAYEKEILNLTHTVKDNYFESLEIATVDKPWYIIHMSKCTLSGHVDMGIKDMEVKEIVYTTFEGNITASQVKKLRDLTKRGMMECKRALQDAKGDMHEAEKILKIRR